MSLEYPVKGSENCMEYKLLLIEDNVIDANVFGQLLEFSGLPVSEFRVVPSLDRAITELNQFDPDVLFLDLTLTDSSGIDTFHKIRNTINNTPIVIITGNEDEKVALDSLRDGAQDYILKKELSPGLIARSALYSIQRKKIEIELLRSKANQEALIENTKDGIWSVDRDMVFMTFNTRFRDSMKLLSGIIPELGTCMTDSLPERYHDWFREVFERALNGEQFRIETVLQFSDQEHHLELSVNPIKIDGGSIAGVSFFGRNINQRKLAEKNGSANRKKLINYYWKLSMKESCSLIMKIRLVLLTGNLLKQQALIKVN
jgi:PAS domain S-box-containing protein